MHAVFPLLSALPWISALQCYINVSQKEMKVWKGEICPEIQAMTKMANLTIFRQRPNSGEWSKDKGINKVANSRNAANLVNMANLAIFPQRPKCNRMSSRHGYEQSSEFDEYDDFGKYGEFDYILPMTKYNRKISRQGYEQSGEFDECGEFGKYANLTIWRIRRMRQFFFCLSAPIGNKTELLDCGHHRTPFNIFLFRFPG